MGCMHIYMGDGKGKTTAAFGLALRAAGCGKKVFIVQFLKGCKTGEIAALSNYENIHVLRNRCEKFFACATAQEKDEIIAENNANLSAAVEATVSGNCDMLILDEALDAYEIHAMDKALLDGLIAQNPRPFELILTGRRACTHLCEAADYITNMQKIKHPYDTGVCAREGIEY